MRQPAVRWWDAAARRNAMAVPSTDRLFSITELAEELGTTARAIRFYESKGLLEPQRAGGNRVYTYRDRARLLLILRGKRLGFSLAEVKEYLDLYAVDSTRKAEQMIHLLRGARHRIAELEEQRRDLELTIEELREIERQTLAAMAAAGVEAPAPTSARSTNGGRARSAAAGTLAGQTMSPTDSALAPPTEPASSRNGNPTKPTDTDR